MLLKERNERSSLGKIRQEGSVMKTIYIYIYTYIYIYICVHIYVYIYIYVTFQGSAFNLRASKLVVFFRVAYAAFLLVYIVVFPFLGSFKGIRFSWRIF